MATKFTLISVQHGVIEDNGQEYASLKVLQDGLETREGYVGLKVGKMKITDRKLAQQLIESISVLPIQIELDTEISFGSGDKMNVVVSGFKPIKSTAKEF